MLQISNRYQLKMSEGLAKDDGQQEPKNGEGTTVTQEVPAPGESTVGGLNKRLREDENNSEVEENLSYIELKETIVSLKKRAEFAEALVVERDNELEENLNEIVSVSEELIEMKKKLKAATEEVTNLQNENRNLRQGEFPQSEFEKGTEETANNDMRPAEVQAAAIRRAKLKSIREARNNIDADEVAQKKEGADTEPPKTSTPNHNHKVLLNISCDSNKKSAEQMETSGSCQTAENSGVWSAQKRIKKVNKPCNRDPCPFGPARCKFLHFTEGKITNDSLVINTFNCRTKESGYGSSRPGTCWSPESSKEELQQPWQRQCRSWSRTRSNQRQLRLSCSNKEGLGENRGDEGSLLKPLKKAATAHSVSYLNLSKKENKTDTQDKLKSFPYTNHDIGERNFIPSIVVYNKSRFTYLESSAFVLTGNQFVNSSWKFLEEPQTIKPAENCTDTNTLERSSRCPFGKLCRDAHAQCQIFKPGCPKRSRRAIRKERFSIYACNVRSINNKKKSIASILESNDFELCILSELSTQNMPRFKGYFKFDCLKPRRNHGISILIKNELKENVKRIPEEELEIVHLRFENTNPPLNIIGVYLEVESRQKVEEVKSLWFKYKSKVDYILEKGEALLTLGDFNRAIDNPNMTCGKKLLIDWVKEDTMTLLNDNTGTRVDPSTKKESLLDLAFVSNNIKDCVKAFKVDTSRSITPCSITGVFSDHYAIITELEVPARPKVKKRKVEMINFGNAEGWNKYEELSNKYAVEIEEIMDSCEDMESIERKIKAIDRKIQTESFGTIWRGPVKKKKVRKRSKKEIIEKATSQYDEMEKLFKSGFNKKDFNQRMYKLRDTVVGPKIKAQEPMAINDPVTKELITDSDEIKRVYLEHNVKILTKNDPPEEYADMVQIKRENHERIMSKPVENTWELDRKIFKQVADTIRKKGKQVYMLFTKAGNKYKEAIFRFMKKIISTEQIPVCYKNTSLTPIWKRKGSALDLNNMRFIHIKHWRSKMIEALVTQKMKQKIVEATPKFQLGGMPKCQSTELLIILKTWMKMKEERKENGIFQVFDMTKFFDRESLLDCMSTLKEKAKIDNKTYHLWYMLNEDTRISVKTSVGQSRSKVIKDSIGQGTGGAALVSSLNIGCSIDEAFKNKMSTKIGDVKINSPTFMDDISNLCDDLEKARDASGAIQGALGPKGLSINQSKSKYLIIGDKNMKKRERILKDAKANPIRLGDAVIENSTCEKYLGDMIEEKGCAASITETIKERIRTLTSKCHDIIQTVENPIMGSLGNSLAPFKLFEATVVESLLTNCPSWIGLNNTHINMLQNFQDSFVRKVLKLADNVPKALLTWDIGLTPMKDRIDLKKLLFLRKMLKKDILSITKQVLYEEVLLGVQGLAYECSEICRNIGIPDIMCFEVTEQEIKEAIYIRMNKVALEEMRKKTKVKDRLSEDPEDNTYIHVMPLTESRVWIRYRGRVIAGVKANFKNSHTNDLSCRFCQNEARDDPADAQDNSDIQNRPDETQEHLEICSGMEFERRGLCMHNRRDLVKFWRRATVKLAKMAVKGPKAKK